MRSRFCFCAPRPSSRFPETRSARLDAGKPLAAQPPSTEAQETSAGLGTTIARARAVASAGIEGRRSERVVLEIPISVCCDGEPPVLPGLFKLGIEILGVAARFWGTPYEGAGGARPSGRPQSC